MSFQEAIDSEDDSGLLEDTTERDNRFWHALCRAYNRANLHPWTQEQAESRLAGAGFDPMTDEQIEAMVKDVLAMDADERSREPERWEEAEDRSRRRNDGRTSMRDQ